jgi:hypothetical protein
MKVSKYLVALVALIIVVLVATVAYELGQSDDKLKNAPQIAEDSSPLETKLAETQESEASETVARQVPTQIEASDSTAKPLNTRELALIDADQSADETCRGGEPSRETDAACERRDETMNRLNAAGICWGKNGEAYVEHTYHRCGADSIR